MLCMLEPALPCAPSRIRKRKKCGEKKHFFGISGQTRADPATRPSTATTGAVASPWKGGPDQSLNRNCASTQVIFWPPSLWPPADPSGDPSADPSGTAHEWGCRLQHAHASSHPTVPFRVMTGTGRSTKIPKNWSHMEVYETSEQTGYCSYYTCNNNNNILLFISLSNKEQRASQSMKSAQGCY